MTTADWRIEIGDDATRAAYDQAGDAPSRVLFICAHGAGGRMNDRGMLATAAAMLAHGIDVVRFNFLYRERSSARPDPMPRLMETTVAVIEHARAASPHEVLVIGGRSMGGRAASMLAAEGHAADGLLLLAYPLHPAGQPTKLRDAHLPRIAMPTLCVNGTRDALCTPALMERVLTTVGPNWRMHWIEGADHSFHVLKSSGRTDADVMREVGATARQWIDGLPAT